MTLTSVGIIEDNDKNYANRKKSCMKDIKIFIIIMIFLVNCKINIYALDTLAYVNVNNTYLVNSHTLEFQLRIQRNSEKWLKFVNGTFQFTFPQGITIDSNEFEIQLYQTDLPETVISGAGLPKKEYLIEYQKFDERFSITILGPENYIDCVDVPTDTSLLLGQFRLIKTGGDPIPNRIDWLTPQNYYQAVAYKIEIDSIESNVTWYYSDDNIDIHDGRNNTFSIDYDDRRPWGFELEDFWVRYAGQTNLQYGWSTRREINAVGYTVLRGYKFSDAQVLYTDTIGTFVDYDHYIADFLSQGISPTGFIYGDFDDQVQYRGGEYSYALWGRLINDEGFEFDSLLSIRDVPVPHAVIVQANATPNPFNISTKINYKLDDDVYLTAFVSDLLGKQVKFLTHPETGEKFDKLLMPMGEHYTIFNAPELASQGLYNIVLIAYPINDPTIEISRAVVKVQLVKDGVR